MLLSISFFLNESIQQESENDIGGRNEEKPITSFSTTFISHLTSQAPLQTDTKLDNQESNLPQTASQNNHSSFFYQSAPFPIEYKKNGPYIIRQQTYSITGELIIENLIGGVPFDCSYKPTGHWRDGKYCDIFHACVFGQQRKSYACPFVGERTYFDQVSKKCEFARLNPFSCSSNSYFY